MTTTNIEPKDTIYQFNSWNMIRQFGITPLTGESDNTGLHRILCDVENEQAKDLLCLYYGVKNMELYSSWNKGIGSILLSHRMMDEICILGLCQQHNTVVLCKPKHHNYNSHILLFDDNSIAYRYLQQHNTYYHNEYDDNGNKTHDSYYEPCIYGLGSNNGRNQHAFTGRTV